MKIEVVRGIFSQFKDSIDIRAKSNSGVLYTELEKNEIPDFVAMLLDVADDCLNKHGQHDEVREALCSVLELLNKS